MIDRALPTLTLQDIAVNAFFDAPLKASSILAFLRDLYEMHCFDPAYVMVSRRDYRALKEDKMSTSDLVTGFVILAINNPITETRVRVIVATDQQEGIATFVKLYHPRPDNV